MFEFFTRQIVAKFTSPTPVQFEISDFQDIEFRIPNSSNIAGSTRYTYSMCSNLEQKSRVSSNIIIVGRFALVMKCKTGYINIRIVMYNSFRTEVIIDADPTYLLDFRIVSERKNLMPPATCSPQYVFSV